MQLGNIKPNSAVTACSAKSTCLQQLASDLCYFNRTNPVLGAIRVLRNRALDFPVATGQLNLKEDRQ